MLKRRTAIAWAVYHADGIRLQYGSGHVPLLFATKPEAEFHGTPVLVRVTIRELHEKE